MNVGDLVLVSVDDHIIEPPDMFEGRLPKKYQDKAPRSETRDDGAAIWVYEGAEIETWGLNAVVGRPPEEYGIEPQNFSEVRPGTWNVHDRVKDMSANGEWGSLNFPTFVGFAGPLFPYFAHRDAEQAMAMVRAYNDWHLEGWCGQYPDRFIPVGITPFWDPALMVKEITRLAELGCHAVTFMNDPYPYPALASEHWDPFWAVCQDVGTVVCIHIGAGAGVNGIVDVEAAENDPLRPPKPPRPEHRVGLNKVGIGSMPGTPPDVAASLLNARIFERFPNLRLALSEGGIGWIPYFLEQADFRLRHHGAWTGMEFGGQMPSDIFKEHVLCCFIEDVAGIQARSLLNMDMLAWECDYPHSDCTWPNSPETLWEYIKDLTDDEITKISHGNAARVFQFDPFTNRTPDQCTVDVLRAEVADHDISIQARGAPVRAPRAAMAGGLAGRPSPVSA